MVPGMKVPCTIRVLTRLYHNDTAASQTVSYDAARRGNGLVHQGSRLKPGEDGK